MATFVCSGSKFLGFVPSRELHHTIRRFHEHSIIIEAPDDSAASAEFLLRSGCRPNIIDGQILAGHCEGCGRPIREDEPGRWRDDEGVQLCPGCAPTVPPMPEVSGIRL